jgi:hypothetical protein
MEPMRHVVFAAATFVLAACGMISGADDLTVGPPAAADAGGASSSSGVTSSSSGGSSSGGSSSGGSSSGSSSSSGGSSSGGSSSGDGGSSVDSGIDAGCDGPTTVGPHYANQVSGNGWNGEPNARLLDGLSTQSNGTTNPLVLSKFGFALSSTVTVVGIRVDVTRTAEGSVTGSSVTIGSGGQNATKTDTGTWPTGGTFETVSYGGPTDTWGKTWTPSSVGDPYLGVALTAQGTGNAKVDAVSVTLYTCP